MFTCNNCKKEYSSHKRYEKHSQKCNGDGDSTDYPTSISSALSSIIHKDKNKDKDKQLKTQYKTVVDKLAKDKDKLKDETKHYRTELNKAQKELAVLVTTNKRLCDEVEATKKKYGEQTNTHIKKLETQISNLQNEVKFLSKEKEILESKSTSTHLQDVYDRDNIISQQTNRIRELEMTSSLNINRLEKLRSEYDNEIENHKQHLSQVERSISSKYEQSYEKIRNEYENILRKEKNRINSELTLIQDEHKKEVLQLRVCHSNDLSMRTNELLSQIEELKRQNMINLNKQEEIYENKLNFYKHSKDEEIANLKTMCNISINEYKEYIKNYEQQIQKKLKAHTSRESDVKEECAVKFQAELASAREEWKEKEEHYRKELETTSLKLGELTDLANEKEQQAEYYKTFLNRIQQETDTINTQFIQNLQNQENKTKEIIKTKEEEITRLTTVLSHTKSEFVDQLNTLQLLIEKQQFQLNEKDHIISQDKDTVKSLRDKLIEKDDQVVCLELQLNRIKDEVEHTVKGYINKLDRQKQNMDRLELQLREENNLIKIKKDEISWLKTDIDSLKMSVEKERNYNKNSENKEISSLKEQIKRKEDLVNDLKDQLSKVKYDFTTQLNLLTSENKSNVLELKKQLEQSNSVVLDYKYKLEKVIADHAEISKKNETEYRKTLIKLELQESRKTKELEQARIELNALNRIYENTKNKSEDIIINLRKELGIVKDECHKKLDEMSRREMMSQTSQSQFSSVSSSVIESLKQSHEKTLIEQKEKSVKEIQTLQDQIVQLQETICNNNNMYNNNINSRMVKDNKEINRLNNIIRELETKNDIASKKIIELLTKLNVDSSDIQRKDDELKRREETIMLKEKEMLANPPTRLLDPTLKQSRDDALARLREQKIKITNLEKEVHDLKLTIREKISIAEEKTRECELLVGTSTDMKRSFIENLNSQIQSHKEELDKKDKRISELEKLITSKFKLAEVTK